MPNRLIHETSPYLLQHAENPVDWYPWGPEATARARREGKPIFLSIGYSACHWCHVMERESFENEEIAKRLNEHFVCIKVDREERPDIDQVYMNAVQLMTGRGGWPLSVFLTPDMAPFFGGTYWPPRGRMGMPGFDEVLQAVQDTWARRRDRAVSQAGEIAERLRRMGAPANSAGELREELLVEAAAKLRQAFDFTSGGFGGEPKFPQPIQLRLLLRIWRRRPRPDLLEMVSLTLDKMARGGIYDHLGGGFARYAVDARWLVPHFEKMLYDNALLAGAYLDGFLATGRSDYARITRETLDYLLAYMTDPEGGFHGTEDADSEGEEGKFYLWTPAQIHAVLSGEAAERFCYVYDVTAPGNFEGKNILNLSKTVQQCAVLRGWGAKELAEELARSRAELLAARDQRPRPGKDDKILVSWNALAIDALARAAAVLDEPRYLRAAQRAARFLLQTLRRGDRRLLHCWRQGQAKYDACLDDYACLIDSLVTLYEADFEERWIDDAVELADQMLRHFSDKDKGGFFYTADDQESLIARNNVVHDASTPSGNAMAAAGLWRLGKLCGRADYLTAARDTLKMAARIMEEVPQATGQMLAAADMALSRFPEIVILGDPAHPDTAEILAKLRSRYWPNRVIACRPQADLPDGSPNIDPIFLGKEVGSGATPAVYVCEGFACRAPALGKEAALAACDDLLAEAGAD